MGTMKSAAGSSGRKSQGERRRRRAYDDAYKRELVERTLVPGVSVAKIALENGLNANLLFTWRRQYLRSLAGEMPKLLPVRVEPTETVGQVCAQKVPAGFIEIDLPGGRIRLKGPVDEQSLRAVVAVLSGR
jgi:transposase